MSPIIVTNSSPSGRMRRVKWAAGEGGGGGAYTVQQRVNLWRFDGNTGTVRVSGGIPFAPGVMTDPSKISLWIGGVEQRIAVGNIFGRWPDRVSKRAACIQWEGALTNGVPVEGEIRYGVTRATTDLTYADEIYFSSNPLVASRNRKAVIACMDSQYLCDTWVLLTSAKPESSQTTTSLTQYFSTDRSGDLSYRAYAGFSNFNNTFSPGVARGTGTTYEHVWARQAAYVRTTSDANRRTYYQEWHELITNLATEEYSQRLGSNNLAYTQLWAIDPSLPVALSPDSYALVGEAFTGFFFGLTSGYLLSGYKQCWRAINRHAGAAFGDAAFHGFSGEWIKNNEYASPRFNLHLGINPLMCAYVIEATQTIVGGYTSYGFGRDNSVESWSRDLSTMIDDLDTFKFTTANYAAWKDGVVGMRPTLTVGYPPSSPIAGRVGVFQALIIANTLRFYYENIKNDSRIPTMLVKLADWAAGQVATFTTGVNTGKIGIPYTDAATPRTQADFDDDALFYPGTIIEPLAAAYAITGTASYKTLALQCASKAQLGEDGSSFVPNIKGEGEYFRASQQSLPYLLEGGVLRPLGNAGHPTAIFDDLPSHPAS
jgi:hypothetical protein